MTAIAGKKIVIAIQGTPGDLLPFVVLGRGLLERGANVSIASNTDHSARVESGHLAWRPMRPETPSGPGLFEKLLDPQRGAEFLFRDLIAPAIRESFIDLQAASRDADLLISTPLTPAGPLVAEKAAIPWVYAALQPLLLSSVSDPPVFAEVQGVSRTLHPLGPLFGIPLRQAARLRTRAWGKPIMSLRGELGLPTAGHDHLWGRRRSQSLTLAMFPSILARQDRNRPSAMRVTGALFQDDRDESMSPNLEAFLAAGEAPIVFTLGTTLVAERFFSEGLLAAMATGRRAVFLVGTNSANRAGLPDPLPPGFAMAGYASHAKLFPRAAAIVHHGGAGTTAQALRAGKPMLVAPVGYDQFDNGARVARRGIGRMLAPRRYRADAVSRALKAMLSDETLKSRAAAVGEAVRSEDGVANACDAIEGLFENIGRAA